jgi:hypothetical protein
LVRKSARLDGTNSSVEVFALVQIENSSREVAMSSPWEPGISQAMQRHGGSNRSIPKTKPSLNGQPEEPSVAETQAQAANAFDRSEKSENFGGVTKS